MIGNNPSTMTLIKVKMGIAHATQWYVNAAAPKPVYAVTNAAGVLPVPVVGSVTPLVHGYLGVWCQIACNRDPLFAPNCDPLTA